MERIRIRFIENPQEPVKEITNNWPENNIAAEQLFTEILANRGETLEFTQYTPWFVKHISDSVWLLCERTAGAPIIKLERVKSPVCNIVTDADSDKYTYFICYRHNGNESNNVVVLDHPVLGIADIRAIEQSLVPKGASRLPTITNIALLAGPQK
jgi:hypothetical protein